MTHHVLCDIIDKVIGAAGILVSNFLVEAQDDGYILRAVPHLLHDRRATRLCSFLARLVLTG